MTTADPTTSPAAPKPAAAAAPKPGDQRSAARSTAGVFVTKLLVFPITLVSGIWVAERLGPAGRGEYAFLILPGSVILPLLSFGFGASIVYFVSSQRFSPQRVFMTCLTAGLLQGLASALIVGALWASNFLGATAGQTSARLMLPVLAILPLQGANLMLTRLIVGNSQFALHNAFTLATAGLNSTLMLALVVAADLRVPGAVAAVVSMNVIMGAVLVVVLWMKIRPEWRWDSAFARRAGHYGLRAWPTDVATRANARFDQLILAVVAPNSTSLGLYSMAVLLTELLWMLPDSLGFVLINKISAERRPAERIRMTDRVHRVMLLVMAVAAGFLAVISPWLIPFVLGESYAGSVPAVLILLPGTVAMISAKVATKFFAGSGMPGRSSVITVAGAIVGVGLCLLLIPTLGVVGAALASSLGYLAMAAAALWVYWRSISPTKPHLFLCRSDDLWWFYEQIAGVLFRRARRLEPPPLAGP